MAGGKEIKAKGMNVKKFIEEKAAEIQAAVGKGVAINARSGGVDSSVVTMLGHRALGERLKTYFIDTGLMRKDEPQRIQEIFRGLGVTIEIVDAKAKFFKALKGLTDPEEKREAITQTFYKDVFGKLVTRSKAKYLLQGTILTDIDETVAGIKRQHNVFEQLGIDPKKAFGYNPGAPCALGRTASGRSGRPWVFPHPCTRGYPSRAGARRPVVGRLHGKGGDREARDGCRRGGAREGEGLPVPGDPSRGQDDRHARRQEGLRPPDRGPVLGFRGRPQGHSDEPALLEAHTDSFEDLKGSARRRERDLQHRIEAAFNDRGDIKKVPGVQGRKEGPDGRPGICHQADDA
jgi:hypothetical protein